MTIVCWDGETLAADCRINGDAVGDFLSPKTYRVGERLYGWCGDVNAGAALQQWIRSGEDPDEFPEMTEDEVPTVMRVSRDGIALLEAFPAWVTVNEPKFAIGSGAKWARAAMALGLDAVAAVEFAIKHESSCGGPVEVMHL